MRRSSLLAGISLAGLILSSNLVHADDPWNAFYAGAHAGYAWGGVDVTDTTGGVAPGPFSYSPKGAFAGGTAGLNWRLQGILLGVEGDLGYMDLSGSGTAPSSTPPNHQDLTLNGGLYAVGAGRLGYAFGQTLIYGKGGFAYFDGTAAQTTTKPGYLTSPTSSAFTGWAYGGGVEHFVSRNLSVKVEYLHFDFGSRVGSQISITDPPIGYKYDNKTDVTADSVKLGFAYHY